MKLLGGQGRNGKVPLIWDTEFSSGDFNTLLIHVENGFEAWYVGIFQDSATLDWFVKIHTQLNCSLGK